MPFSISLNRTQSSKEVFSFLMEGLLLVLLSQNVIKFRPLNAVFAVLPFIQMCCCDICIVILFFFPFIKSGDVYLGTWQNQIQSYWMCSTCLTAWWWSYTNIATNFSTFAMPMFYKKSSMNGKVIVNVPRAYFYIKYENYT